MHPLSRLLRIAGAIALFFFVYGATGALAQTPTPTPTEEELRLQEEKRLIELRRDIEQAKKAIRDAQPKEEEPAAPPAPSATPLAGDTTLENVKLESEMVAYKAMSEAADLISKQIKNKKGSAKNIAIYDAQVVKDWRFYRALFPAFEGQVLDIKAQYKALLCQTPSIAADVDDSFKETFCKKADENQKAVGDVRTLGNQKALGGVAAIQTAFGAGTNLLKSFIDLAALFRTDTKIQGNAFTIDESALVAEIFRALKNDYTSITLYYPEVFPPRVKEEDPSETVTIIGDLFIYKTMADSVIKMKNERKDELVKKMDAPSKEKAKLEEEQAPLKKIDERLKNLTASLAAEKNPAVKRKIRAEIARVTTELATLLTPDGPLNETLEDVLKRKLGELEAKIKKLEEQLKPLQAEVKEIDADVKRLTRVNERFLSFVDEFVKVGSNGVNALALFIKSEDIQKTMADTESYWLEIKSVTAGGNNRVRKNLLRYFTGAKLDHSGGVIIEYALYDKTGAVVYSDKLSVYGGYVEPKKIINKKVDDLVDTVGGHCNSPLPDKNCRPPGTSP